jgi:hypothetical protein
MHIYKLLSDELELKTKPKEVLAVRTTQKGVTEVETPTSI